MKRGLLPALCVVGLCIASAYSFPAGPVGVSPGSGSGETVVGSVFPTFSWSGVEGAVGYMLEVFKAVDDAGGHDEMTQREEPVIRLEIAAPALSWSPSGNEALQAGESYIWYVKAFYADGEGPWSGGNRFRIDASVALTGMDEALRDKVRGYVRTDTEVRGAIREIWEEAGAQGSRGIAAPGTSDSPEAGRLKGTEGYTNTFYGLDAGTSNTGGTANTFIGKSAGYSNTTGSDNTFIGSSAGSSNTTGIFNTFIGNGAGRENTTGEYNTFVGQAAGYSNTGSANTLIGVWAGDNITTGNYNTLIGFATGHLKTNGFCNTFIGSWAGQYNTTGSGNVFLGYRAGFNESGSNKLYIHNSESSSPLLYGDFSARQLTVNGALTIADLAGPSDISLKKDLRALEGSLEKIASLKGVSYNWRTEEYPDRGFTDKRQIGLIAQDVEKVLPELVRTEKDGKKSISYDRLTAVLVEAVKAQQAEIQEQNSRLSALKAELQNQKARLSSQQAEMEAIREMLAATKAEMEELRRLVTIQLANN